MVSTQAIVQQQRYVDAQFLEQWQARIKERLPDSMF
jgi:hypothetical protein